MAVVCGMQSATSACVWFQLHNSEHCAVLAVPMETTSGICAWKYMHNDKCKMKLNLTNFAAFTIVSRFFTD